MWLLEQKDTQRLRELLNFRGIFISSETGVEQLFRHYYRFFGFTKISPISKPYMKSSFGDYFAWQSNERKRVELELIATHFFGHKPEVRQEIDILVAASFPYRKKSQLWAELREKRTIDLSQWFDLLVIPPSHQLWLLSLMKQSELN
jgi:hypothetical protein